MKKELNPTKNKAHSEIISNFEYKSKNIFCLVDFEHEKIMESLGVDYLIMDNINAFLSIDKDTKTALRKYLNNKNIFFLTTSFNDYLALLTDLKYYFKGTVKPYCIDIEVLKAYELIPCEEMSQNDYQMGLELVHGHSFKDYVDEIVREQRNGNEWLNIYIKQLLNNEANRQLQKA
jgi:hypothetical protein